MARWCEFANPARRWLNKLLILPLETAKFFNKKRIQKLPDPVFEALADLNSQQSWFGPIKRAIAVNCDPTVI